jgi:hypothetical protein
MSKTSDMQETAGDLNNHPMVAAEERKMMKSIVQRKTHSTTGREGPRSAG